VTVQAGDTIQACLNNGGPAYLAFGGGLNLPEVLGSRSTYARAQLGGVQGRSLQAGDVLPCFEAEPGAVQHDTQASALVDRPMNAATPNVNAHGESSDTKDITTLRAILGPQQNHFTPQAIGDFFSHSYQVGSGADRMGLRLQGPILSHSEKG